MNKTRYSISVPCFIIKSTAFLHSGSYYVVCRGNEISYEIMNMAMAEFGETYPGGDNFWFGEIHSVKGLITIASILDGNYSKNLVNNITNETYKNLLKSPLLASIHCNFFERSITKSKKMQTLCKLLEKYSNAVNPFGDESLTLKDPIKYSDKVDISFAESTKKISIQELI